MTTVNVSEQKENADTCYCFCKSFGEAPFRKRSDLRNRGSIFFESQQAEKLLKLRKQWKHSEHDKKKGGSGAAVIPLGEVNTAPTLVAGSPS